MSENNKMHPVQDLTSVFVSLPYHGAARAGRNCWGIMPHSPAILLCHHEEQLAPVTLSDLFLHSFQYGVMERNESQIIIMFACCGVYAVWD